MSIPVGSGVFLILIALSMNNGIKFRPNRLLSQISKNWRGKPLETYNIIVNLIGATKTKTGLKVKADIDNNIYETGIKISKSDFEKINIYKHEFHGEDWNYTIKPLYVDVAIIYL